MNRPSPEHERRRGLQRQALPPPAPPRPQIFAINLVSQHVVPLASLPQHVPPLRHGKPIHASTVHRWVSRGLRVAAGTWVKLPVIKVGGTFCTSLEAFQWWAEELGRGTTKSPASLDPPARREDARRRREQEIDRDLDERGL